MPNPPEAPRLSVPTRQRLRTIATELRSLGVRTAPLEIILHDMARILEQLASLEDIRVVDELQVILHLKPAPDSWTPED